MLKAKAINLLIKSNAFAPVRFFNRGKFPILMYHRFSQNEEFGKTSKKTFESHLSYLIKYYNIISLDDLLAYQANGQSVPPRSTTITIDDGYRDFYEIAFPILKKFNLPATLYVVTGFVGRENWIWTDKARYIFIKTAADQFDFTIGAKRVAGIFHDVKSRLAFAGEVNSELKKMNDPAKETALQEIASEMSVSIPDLPPDEFAALNWNKAAEMQNNNIEIGSHTASHPILTNVPDDVLKYELRKSKLVLEEKLQKKSLHFCYPNGNAAERERAEAESAGYASAVTTEIRLCENKDDPFLLPRIDAEPEMHRFVQSTSGFDRFKNR